MRTTVDIPESLLRKAKAKAALDGKKLKDIVNEALEDLLSTSGGYAEVNAKLPANIRLVNVGQFRVPVLRSSQPGKTLISPKELKELELNEEAARYADKK